jgi:hypothetical protein
VRSTVVEAPRDAVSEQAEGAVTEEEEPQRTRKVDIELRFSDSDERSKQLTKIGYALVGATTVIALLQSGDDGKGSKKKKGGKSAAKPPKRANLGSMSNDDLFGTAAATSRSKMASSSKFSKGVRDLNLLPPADELFDDEDADKFFSGTSDVEVDKDKSKDTPQQAAAKSAAASISKAPRARATKLPSIPKPSLSVDEDRAVEGADEDEVDVPPSRKVAPAPAPAPVPAPIAVSPPSPPPPVQKKNIFDRIFQKSTSNRPTDLADVLRINDASTLFRTVSVLV